MSKLVIVESPTKVKSIKKYLGSDYTVMASMGHIRDLPKSRFGIDVKNNYKINYTNMSDKKDLIKKLKDKAADSEFVYLATDPDREGEAISWHLAHILGLSLDDDNRVCFNEITKSGVENGMKHPRKINTNLVDAQQARRVLDRIVGYKISPFLWKKVKSGLSAGRVQSVALRLIVDREREIEGFIPEEYWTVDVSLAKGKKGFVARFYGKNGSKIEIKDESEALKIVKDLQTKEFVVENVTTGNKKRQPSPPFTTSTLQQEASRKLGFTGQKTMRVAQQLYEGVDIKGFGMTGLITYMRTDSLRISEEARKEATELIQATFGKNYLPSKPRYFKSKASAQDAHEAIRPTDPKLLPKEIKQSLTADQFKLYKLIWDRFISSLMAEQKNKVVSVDISADEYNLKASETSVLFDGFTVLYEEGKDEAENDAKKLPELTKGDNLTFKKAEPLQHFTQPQARYTEPTLIKALDENGIGRPSTYAPILANILTREYIERDKKSLKPTALGMVVSDLLTEYFGNIVDVKFTAGMESDLDKIEDGAIVWTSSVDKFYKDFEKTLQKAEKEMADKKVEIPAEETDVVCELCGKKMVIKSGRFGKFLACPGYPECKNTKPLPQNEIKEPCPVCGSKLVSKVSKKGKRFYGCSNYPECNFAAPSLPTGEKCPTCGNWMLKGTRGRTYCLNSECPTRKEWQKNKEDGQKKE